MIHVKNITKEFGPIKAVSDVSFRADSGEILGFLGPNGAGKTTTMRILSGIFPPTQGTAEVAGFDVGKNPLEIRKRIGYLPEQVPLYPELTVHEYLDFVASVWNLKQPQRSKRMYEVLEQCGLIEMEDALIGRLSRGYRQRLGLAQTLIHDPEVLILDEPTVGLDPKQIREIRDLIKSFKGSKTVILSTHILPEVSMTCDKVIIIDHGKVVAQGTPESLTQQTGNLPEVEIQVQGNPEEILKALRILSGVNQVKIIDSKNPLEAKFLIQTEKGEDVRAQIARTIVGKNWGLLELKPRLLTLEEVFVRLVTKEESS